jgi:hypothetical protein
MITWLSPINMGCAVRSSVDGMGFVLCHLISRLPILWCTCVMIYVGSPEHAYALWVLGTLGSFLRRAGGIVIPASGGTKRGMQTP